MPLNAELNRLLIDLGRSLLQYVGECWPWTAATSHAQDALRALVRRQQAGIGRLAQLLNDRDWPIDFGTYPTEYTDLHYCALDFLLEQLLVEATAQRGVIDGLRPRASGDPEAARLLDALAAEQLHIVEELRRLAKPAAPAGSAA